MADPQQLGILLEGVEAWNHWRWENPDIRPYLREADLSRSDLSGAHLAGAHLGEANLFSANLCGANLRGANLTGVDLSDADLHGADLAGAWAARARFVNVDLRGVKGLDALVHSGPSTVGIDTIYKSNGQIPPAFLRGCGVPDALITYIPSLVAAQAGIEYRSVFLCYSIENHDFAERLSTDLEAHGFRCWFSPHSTDDERRKDGRDCSIQMLDKQLFILSTDSIHSPWIRSEAEKALLRGFNENRRVIYPVSICSLEELEKWHGIDPHTGRDYAREIRDCFIPNFSNWQDPYSYRQVFSALLRDLQSEVSAAPSCCAFDPKIETAVA
jgi:hypothetical protein